MEAQHLSGLLQSLREGSQAQRGPACRHVRGFGSWGGGPAGCGSIVCKVAEVASGRSRDSWSPERCSRPSCVGGSGAGRSPRLQALGAAGVSVLLRGGGGEGSPGDPAGLGPPRGGGDTLEQRKHCEGDGGLGGRSRTRRGAAAGSEGGGLGPSVPCRPSFLGCQTTWL